MSGNWGSMAAQFRVSEAVSLGGRVTSWARNRGFTPPPGKEESAVSQRERGFSQSE
jgi:hypothetical protein